jgi:hypothetical protein
LLAAWFTYFCGRTFGLKPVGAMMAGLVYGGNGFFIIHFPHQWAYTSGSWLPLAVAFAWRAARPNADTASVRSRVQASLALAAVIAVQMLIGHFQVAFYTQVVVLLIGVSCTVQYALARLLQIRRMRRGGRQISQDRASAERGVRAAVLWIAVPIAGAFALAAVQVWPTYELIRIAVPGGRNFEYLSGFANTPFHLISYLLPTLFHVNPLWRPIAWDPFHTSPEECFAYIGLLPICLSLAAAWRWRREPRVGLWVLLAAVTLIFSLGPYFPGFRALILLPGFSGFRAASRWGIVTALFLALLSGRALDGLSAAQRLRQWLMRFTALFVLIAGIGWACVTAMLNPARPSSQSLLTFAESIRQAISPWPQDVGVERLAQRAQQYASDERSCVAMARLRNVHPDATFATHRIFIGRQALFVRPFSLAGEARAILQQEFAPPLIAMGVIWLIVWFTTRGRRVSPIVVLMVTAADLGAASWLRPVDYIRRTSLVRASPVLSYLAETSGRRGLDIQPNIAMLAGAAPAQSYRTVDIPVLNIVNATIDEPQFYPLALRREMLSRSNISWRLYSGTGDASKPSFPDDRHVDFSDPLLGRMLFGAGFLRQFPEVANFHIRESPQLNAAPAWWIGGQFATELYYLAARPALPRTPLARDNEAMRLFRVPAEPVQQTESEPEHVAFRIHAPSPGAVFISTLYYPGWQATLTTNSHSETVPLLTPAGCQAVTVPAAGDYTLDLSFRSSAFERGWRISVASACAWTVLLLWLCVYGWKRRGV